MFRFHGVYCSGFVWVGAIGRFACGLCLLYLDVLIYIDLLVGWFGFYG